MPELFIEDRLSSGMKASEAVSLASDWWDNTGRRLIRTQFNTVNGMPVIPSGLLLGVEFNALTREEQKRVVKTWHEFYVVMNDAMDKVDAGMVDAVKRLQLNG